MLLPIRRAFRYRGTGAAIAVAGLLSAAGVARFMGLRAGRRMRRSLKEEMRLNDLCVSPSLVMETGRLTTMHARAVKNWAAWRDSFMDRAREIAPEAVDG